MANGDTNISVDYCSTVSVTACSDSVSLGLRLAAIFWKCFPSLAIHIRALLTRKRRGFIKRFVYQNRMFAGNICAYVGGEAEAVAGGSKAALFCRELGKS